MATNRLKTESITYNILPDKLLEFVNKMIDLTRINDVIKFTFDKDNLLIYSCAGVNDNIHCFKSFVFKIDELFEKVNKQLEEPVIFILSDAKKVSQVLRFYQKFEDIIELKVYYNEDNNSEKVVFKNSKLKDEISGSPAITMKANIDMEQISETMDTSLAEYSFKLNKKDFDILKAKASLEKTNDIYYLNIKDGKVYLGENKSRIYVDDVEHENCSISFPKKYFNTMNFEGSDELVIWIFETFVLALSDKTNLLITTELSV